MALNPDPRTLPGEVLTHMRINMLADLDMLRRNSPGSDLIPKIEFLVRSVVDEQERRLKESPEKPDKSS